MRKAVFRVDSGTHMGIGHVMRCLTLAQELKQNFEIHFICKKHLGANIQVIESYFPVHLINGGVKHNLSDEEKNNYDNWLGGDWKDDLAETNNVLESLGEVAIVIVDHYSLDGLFEKELKTANVFVIDDLMNRSHECVAILDQNISADLDRYKELTTEKCKEFFIGPKYSLLRAEFREERKSINPLDFDREIKHIVVFFGASDPRGDTLKFVKNVFPEFGQKYNFSLILDSNHQDYKACAEFMRHYSNCNLISFSKSFLQLMKSADLFIGAGGTTTWERACLGVASALMTVAENQKLVCQKLQRKSICYYLGESSEMTKQKWHDFFAQIVPQSSLWYSYRVKSFALVDGEGALEVSSALKRLKS